MIKFFVLGAAAMLTTSISLADLEGDPAFFKPAPAPAMSPAATFVWTGFYNDLKAGYGGTFRHRLSVSSTEFASLNISASGFVLGGQLGFNMQLDRFIDSAEADIQWANVRSQVDVSVPGLCASAALGTDVNRFGTVCALLGYTPINRMMVFGTAGLVYSGMTSYACGSGGIAVVDESTRSTRWGSMAGAGVEYAFADALSLKTEYFCTALGLSSEAPNNAG